MTQVKEKIGIIVDSFSGWDRKEANAKGIFFVPLRVTINGQEYLDGVDLSAIEMIEKIKNIQNAKSSAPIPRDYHDIYEKAFKAGCTKLLVLPCSAGFSITGTIAHQVAQEYDGKVIVYRDSVLTSTATQDVAIKAIEKNKQGASFDEVFKYIKQVNDSQLLLIVPKNLQALKRGGRIPKSLGTLMNWMRVIPIIRYDGINHKQKIMRTQTKAVDWAVQWMKEQIGNVNGYTCSLLCSQVDPITLFIENTNNKLRIALVNTKVKINRVSALIAIHTGVGAIGILAYKL